MNDIFVFTHVFLAHKATLFFSLAQCSTEVPKRQLLIEDDLDDDLPKNPIIERSKKRKEEAPFMGKETGRVPSFLVGIIIMIHHYNILDIIAIHHYHTPLF